MNVDTYYVPSNKEPKPRGEPASHGQYSVSREYRHLHLVEITAQPASAYTSRLEGDNSLLDTEGDVASSSCIAC